MVYQKDSFTMAYQKDNPPKGVLHVNREGEFVDHICKPSYTHRIRAPMAHFCKPSYTHRIWAPMAHLLSRTLLFIVLEILYVLSMGLYE